MSSFPKNMYRTPCADKNDKLGWVTGFSVKSGEAHIGVRTNDPGQLDTLKSFVPNWCALSEQFDTEELLSLRVGPPSKRKGVTNYHLVYDSWTRVARTRDLQEALREFRIQLYARIATSQRLLAHPGSCFRLEDKAVVVFGAPAARAEMKDQLLSRGAALFSEQVVFYDFDGMVKGDSATSSEPLPMGELIFTDPRNQKEMTPGEAAITLFANSFGPPTRHKLGLFGRFCSNVPRTTVQAL